jgi:hypothetical protein
MKQVYILVEGPTDAEFLRRILLPDVLADAEVFPAGGNSGIPSLARSILVRRKKPVVVVMDADTNDPDLIAERRDSMEELIRAADSSTPVKVVAAVPEIEAWFFAAPDALARTFGAPLPSECVLRGQTDPKGTLQHLAQKNKIAWEPSRAISLLDHKDIDNIRAVRDVTEINTFLEALKSQGKAA